MQHEAGMFKTHDGEALYTQWWYPDDAGKIKAHLAVVHGLGEHSGRYEDFAAWFTPLGYAVHAFDLRGHGQSPGVRGYIREWEDIRGDVRVFLGEVQQRADGIQDAPLFLIGHSLGGLIVLEYGLFGEVSALSGLVASAPALARGEGVSPLVMWLGKVLARFAPQKRLAVGLDVQGLSRNPDVVQAYRDDPLVHGWGTPSGAVAIDGAMKRTTAHAGEWPDDLPLLIVHGGADSICPPTASARFYANVHAPDKMRHEYLHFRHEVFNDVGREKVLEDVRIWLADRLAV